MISQIREAGVLIATAGALRIKLGGSRCVQGLIKQEPLVGNGDDAARYHIEETQSLAEDHYSYGQSQHSSLLHFSQTMSCN